MRKTYLIAYLLCTTGASLYANSTNIQGSGIENITLSNEEFTQIELSDVLSANLTAIIIDPIAASENPDNGNAVQNGINAISIQDNASDMTSAGFTVDTLLQQYSISNATSINGGNGGSTSGTDVVTEADGGNALQMGLVDVNRFMAGSDALEIVNAIFEGGNGGSVISGIAGTSGSADGGDGLNLSDIRADFIAVSSQGGNGGSINGQGAAVTADGGDGLLTGFDAVIGTLDNNSSFSGGNAGEVNVNASMLGVSSGVVASGGDGVNYQGVPESFFGSPIEPLLINGAIFEGGNGGIVINNSDDPINIIDVDGGHGFYTALQSVVVSNGTFRGGDAGDIEGTQNAFSADGGHGLYLNNYFPGYSLEIYDGQFEGGQSGSVDGISSGNAGFGVKVVDIETIIHGGSFIGNGLSAESLTNNQVVSILGGEFDNVIFSATNGYTSSISLSGASFDEIIFNGPGGKDILLAQGVIDNGVNVLAGTVDVHSWEDTFFSNVLISDASLTFNTGNFTLSNGGEIDLTHENAALNLNGGTSTFEGGSTLDIGLGAVSGTAIVMESDSVTTIGVSANGASSTPTKGTLTASGSINFEEGAIVQLVNDGTYTKWDELEGTDGIIIANASSITALNTNQVSIVGDKPWLTGVIGLNFDAVSDNLYAEIGLLDLGTALNATGELATMADKLQPLIDGSAEIAELFRDGFPTQQAAISGITDSFFRAPEVANSLFGLQTVVRDQVAGRTRGYLKANRFGASAPSGPRGPDAGWWGRSMERINESLPKADLRGGLDALNASLPKVELSLDRQEDQQQSYYKRFMNWLNEKAPSFKPSALTFTSDYKSWGKAYYSDLAQDAVDGFAGYEAQVIGGIAGMDRKLDHGVLGWAAGYADTTILGNFGQNADVDTLHGTIYYTIATQRAYLDASMSYAYSLVETIGPAGAGEYTADYTASNLSFSLGAGVGFTTFDDRIQITPEVLAQCSFYDQEAYTESSSVSGMPDKQFRAYDEWSPSIELGVTLSPMQLLESTSMNLAIQPEFRIHWLHELNLTLDPQIYSFNGSSFSAASQNREENLLRTGLGIRFWDWADHRTEFSFDLDAITGSDYEEFTVSGSFIHRF